MKKLLFLFCSILLFISCEKETINNEPDEIVAIGLKGKMAKVDVCHKGNVISINGNALDEHLNHGDIIGECMTETIYDFNDCSIDGFNTNGEGTFSIIDNGINGCGVSLTQPIRMKTDSQFSYGTYEMDTRASTGVSNQYMRLFVSDDFNTIGVDVGIQPDGTDDEGYTFIVNGEIIRWEIPSEIPVSYPNWYHVKVEVTPDYIKFWLDDNLMLEMFDYGGINNPIGSFEVSSFSTSDFDNLVYTPL